MLRVSYSNTMAERVGEDHGLTGREWKDALATHGSLCRTLRERRQAGQLAFLDLPNDQKTPSRILDFARRRAGQIHHVILIGTDGSSLGAAALVAALGCPVSCRSGPAPARRQVRPAPPPCFHLLDHVDPEETQALLSSIDPSRTLVHVVSPSGETAGAISAFLVFLDLLRQRLGKSWRSRLVVTTAPDAGFLGRLARKERLETFDLPAGVCGRFAALSPAGMLPAALAGIDIRKLLAGADRMESICSRTRAEDNPAFVAALLHHLLHTRRGKTEAVFLPFARALRGTADWFAHLWNASLGCGMTPPGKADRPGPTVIRVRSASGTPAASRPLAVTLHDRLAVFVETERFRTDLEIPPLDPDDESTAFLGGQTLGRLVHEEKRGLEAILADAGTPSYTLRLPAIAPDTVGELIYFLQAQTAFAALLYGIDGFDQPGPDPVETAVAALLGRKGLGETRRSLERRFGEGGKYVVD